MMLSAKISLLASVCLLLVVSLEGKVKSRAKLLDLEEQGADVGLPQSQSFQSFPINAQPMFAARAPAVLPKDEVVLSRNRNKMQQQHQQHDDYDRIESLVQELDRAQSPLEDEINQQMISRDKKSKADAAAETAPLASHRRKNFFDKDNSASGSVKTCPSQMNVQASTILDSKTSIQKGAKFLRVEYIELQSAKKGLNFVQDECKRLCCEDSVCDTSLLAMKLNNNDNRYRCYLYECQDLCSMVPHKDYYVFMVKDAEQSQIPAVEKPSSAVGQGSNDITTGHDHGACHKQYEFKCVSNGACIPVYDVCNSFDDCDDKSDEMNCTTASISTSEKKTSSRKDKMKSSKDYVVDNGPVLIEDDDDEATKTDDDYEIYKKLKQQADLVEHLDQLESEFEGRGKGGGKSNKNVVYKTDQEFLDSLMKESPSSNKNRFESGAKSYFTTKSTTTKQSQPKIKFHDAHNFDMSVDTFQNSLVSPEPSPNYSDKLKLSDEDRAYFFDKSLASKSSIAMAVIILILGICLVIAFFLYLVVNTKFIAKRIKWIGGGKKLGKNNLDVEADYLINGMYL